MTLLLDDLGTIEWTRRTQGILRPAEAVRFHAAVLVTTAGLLPRMVAARLGRTGSGPDPSVLEPPDTPLVREVLAAVPGLDPMLVEHGYRSYLYAAALAQVDGLEVEHEPLLIAAILHDVAFPRLGELTGECFTRSGAAQADELLRESSLTTAQRHDVLDAITLHLNPVVRPDQGALQHLMHDGVLLDVIGARAWQLDEAGVRRVAECHPRHGFTVQGRPLLRSHARRVPGSRSAALFRCGFSLAVSLGPWQALDTATPDTSCTR